MSKRNLRSSMASFAVITLLLVCCAFQLSYGQEAVHLPLCDSYNTTSFRSPNVFNHTSQEEAIFHMHTFSPLVVTFCHRHLIFFLCLVHIPWYLQAEDSPPVLQPACRSLCDDVYSQCKYTMDKLHFHWPDTISCDKFGNATSCIAEDPKRQDTAIDDLMQLDDVNWLDGNFHQAVPNDCSRVHRGGSPICSSVELFASPKTKYFVSTNNPFVNYFGHRTQQEAIYELSTHGKLIHLLISQQPYIDRTNEVTQCLNDIRFLLCNLYLPLCGDKNPNEYPITSDGCRNTLGKNCSSAILQLRNRGYNITWPPVNVNCNKFQQTFEGRVPKFKSERTFGGLSPPPPALSNGNVGPDFLEIKWNSFPEEYKFGTTVETGILYKESGLRVQYNQERARANNFTLSGLNSNTAYEILVVTVNNNSMYPGTFEEIKLKTVRGAERIQLGFCSSLYNFTKLPNMFGHQTQDEALSSTRKFGPLLDTGCSSDLKPLICSSHFPNYLPESRTTQLPCRSLCERVLNRCNYAIDKLNFLWPEELHCESLPQKGPCYGPSSLPQPIESDVCELVQEQSICSFITRPDGTDPYFATVEKKFKNYFNHTSQAQAVYELSKHAKLLSSLSALISVDPRNTAIYTQCIQKLAQFLCSFYLPNCRAGIEISQADCKSIVGTTDFTQPRVCSQAVSRLQGQFGFAITWPPVQVDCDSINPSVATPPVKFNDIRFQDILPPPPGITYITNGKSLELSWRAPILAQSVSGFAILFKTSNTKTAYDLLLANLQSSFAKLNVDTSKDYEVFVAVLNAEDEMPGYFQRISYTAGSSVDDAPITSPCERYSAQTVLPNSFGDTNITAAANRLYPFYPLIHTLCSEDLTAFLCSIFLPRYDFGQQRVCQSTCKKITTSCSYAISRTKFFWPQELTCNQHAFQVEECFDVTVSANQNPPLSESRKKRALPVDECKPTTTAMCLAVRIPIPESEQDRGMFTSTFSSGILNYFKHSSTDEAIFELSQHLRLLSTLQEFESRRNGDARVCNRDLTVLLCHLYLPACPRAPLAESMCINTFSSNSSCFKVVNQINEEGYDLKWPPVKVNCQDRNWFSPNATVNNVQISTFVEPAPPPPRNVEVSERTLDQLSVRFTLIDPAFSDARGAALLYRQNNSGDAYSLLRTEKPIFPGTHTLNMKELNPKTGYEIKVATFFRRSESLGIFRTITDRTFDAGVIDVPNTLDICYNFYKKASLPNMYGDALVETAKQRFLPFYPLVQTFCSSELETFLCSVFFPRYNPVTFISQKPCRAACERVYRSCKYAIGRSSFFWPPSLECGKFSNDATCYNLTRDERLPSPWGEGFTTRETSFQPQRRRRATSAECKPTPSTPMCANVFQYESESSLSYFRTTFQYGNYFGHESTDEAVYELSTYANLLSSLLNPDNRINNPLSYRFCYQALTVLLCHLHLPICPWSPLRRSRCFEAVGTNSSCFNAIKNLNAKGANFEWPPVKVNCSNATWFRPDDVLFDVFAQNNNPFGPPAPRNVDIIPRYSTRMIVTFNDTQDLNTTALYRRSGTVTAYQSTTIPSSSGFGTLTLEQLIPSTDYEIKLARLRAVSGLPGPFVTHTSNTIGQCQNDSTGDDIAQGKILWTTQDGNTTQTRKCPYGENDLEAEEPSRFCECDVATVCKNPFWLHPDTTACNFNDVDDPVTLTLSGIAEMLSKNELSQHNASEELVQITSQHAPEFTENDLVLSTLILENIVQNTEQLNKTGPNIVRAIDNLLNTALNVLAESQKKSNATARIIVVLDQYLENVPLNPGQNFSQNEENIAVHTQEYDPRNFEGAGTASIEKNEIQNLVVYDTQSGVQPDISRVSLTLPESLFRDLDIDTKSQNQRISFAIYRKTSFFTSLGAKRPNTQTNTVRKINSFVVSGSVKGQRLTNLTDPIRTTYQPLKAGIDETTACVFWNFTDENGTGGWSSVGCSFQGIEDGVVTCHCTHLTNFAILMDVHIEDRDDDHDKALSIISYIGCAISLVGLVLTMITIIIFKDLRSKTPTQILLNFCIALSLTLIVFLAAAERSKTSSLGACRAAAIALHYFVLAMFVWTSIQAYNMYLAFVKVMPRYHSKFILKCCVVGWGLPAVIVIIAAAVAIEEYGDENFCRVQGLPFQIGFLAPVVLILVVNSVAFALIIRSLLNAGSKVAADKRATGLQHARRGAAILVVLGLTWLFGVLAVRDAKLVFQYLFCIFNSIQGLLVFVFYCLLSSETRAKYRKLLGGESKESDTSGKHRYPASSSEGRFREVNSNKKTNNVYTTSTGSSSLPSSKPDLEMARI